MQTTSNIDLVAWNGAARGVACPVSGICVAQTFLSETVRRVSMLDQHRRQMTREREKKLRLSKDVQTISRRLSEKRPKIARATTESTSKSRQREVDSLERDLLRAEGKVVDQDMAIVTLQKRKSVV